jgi:signal peptidase II
MFAAIVAALTVIIDQLTKVWAVKGLGDTGKVNIIEGVLSFTYTENRGAAFGMLQGQRWFFLIVTIPAIVILAYLIWKERPNRMVSLSLALILGGAVGNLIDRVFLNYVRDFIYIELINFPIFNVADMGVTIGAAMLICMMLFKKEPVFEFKFLEKKVKEKGKQDGVDNE